MSTGQGTGGGSGSGSGSGSINAHLRAWLLGLASAALGALVSAGVFFLKQDMSAATELTRTTAQIETLRDLQARAEARIIVLENKYDRLLQATSELNIKMDLLLAERGIRPHAK